MINDKAKKSVQCIDNKARRVYLKKKYNQHLPLITARLTVEFTVRCTVQYKYCCTVQSTVKVSAKK